jgi:endoglucanase
MTRLNSIGLTYLVVVLGTATCCAQDWLALWKNYTAAFMDNQVRVIDHDAGDRTTSEGQAYGMFFALVANDRSRFDGLLHWTEVNLASGDLSAHLPAWSWGKNANNKWGVLDSNSAADADVWMAYTLLQAGGAWKETRYVTLGTALAKRIATEEVAQIPGLGTALLPGARGFHNGNVYRLNASYLPLQLLTRLGHQLPDGAWEQIGAEIAEVVRGSAPSGFVADWVEFTPGRGFIPSALCSYDAIRVYLWAGMLDPGTTGRDEILKALPGMARYLHTHAIPPAKIRTDGTVEDPKSPVGFSAALLPYLSALSENNLENEQVARVQAGFNSKSGLYGTPAKYYDQNLILFAFGWKARQFWFDSQGALDLAWKSQ